MQPGMQRHYLPLCGISYQLILRHPCVIGPCKEHVSRSAYRLHMHNHESWDLLHNSLHSMATPVVSMYLCFPMMVLTAL